jgi:hypothetical protein
MKPRSVILLSLLILLAGAPAASAGIRALLVGIAEYPAEAGVETLGAPPNDLKLMKDLLVGKFGAAPEMILTLQDRQATSRGIQEAFRRHLIDQCQPEDAVVFYFVGHGTQVPDGWPDPGDETEDQLDEALVPYDYRESDNSTWLNDDMMHRLLKAVPARHVMVVFDSCHAGTGTRGTRGVDTPFHWKTTASPVLSESSIREASALGHHVFFSACRAGEKAHEIRSEELDDWVGAFTSSFVHHAGGDGASRPMDEFLGLIGNSVAQEVKKRNEYFRQTPLIESRRSDFSLEAFLGGDVYPANSIDYRPTPNPGPQEAFVGEGELEVTLNTNQSAYVWTESLTATATVNRPAYLRVIHVDAEGAQTQIYPNKLQPQRLIPAGETLQLPPPGRQLRVTGPSQGLEMLIAVASSRPFGDKEATTFGEGLFNALPAAPVSETMSRGIGVEGRNDPVASAAPTAPGSSGRAVRIYRVSQF